MKSLLLAVVALLVIALLPLQGFSTAMQRSWMPHYHAALADTSAAPMNHAQSQPHAVPASQVTVVAIAAGGDDARRHDHPHTASTPADDLEHPHAHPSHHAAPATVSVAATVSAPAAADERHHDHATLGRHHHDRDAADVVYVEDPQAPSPESITRPTGFDNFWTILPSPLALATAQTDAEPPSLSPLHRPSPIAGVPDRPPRR